MALHNRKKLADIDRNKFGLSAASKGIYINESLCRPMQFLSYKVRQAFKAKRITSFNLWKGKLTIKMNDQTILISHIEDLIELDLAAEEDRLSFF